MRGNKVLGVILYISIFIISIVLAPISVMPLIPFAARLWGLYAATALSVIGWTIGSMIAFYLARKFGKPYVSKIIPLKTLEKLEEYVPETNVFWSIFFFRAVTPIDGLSYVLGLVTTISFRTFSIATFFGLIPFCFVISFLGSLPLIFLIIGLILAFMFSIIGTKRMKKSARSKI